MYIHTHMFSMEEKRSKYFFPTKFTQFGCNLWRYTLFQSNNNVRSHVDRNSVAMRWTRTNSEQKVESHITQTDIFGIRRQESSLFYSSFASSLGVSFSFVTVKCQYILKLLFVRQLRCLNAGEQRKGNQFRAILQWVHKKGENKQIKCFTYICVQYTLFCYLIVIWLFRGTYDRTFRHVFLLYTFWWMYPIKSRPKKKQKY